VRQIAILLAPVMPGSAAKLLDSLAQEADERSFACLGAVGRLTPGGKLPPPVAVFPRYLDAGAEGTAKPSKPQKS
jgi:methionyl-tRNA synthetase